MSMRMCSFSSRSRPRTSRNTAPNSYHCNSSQAFELMSNTLRTIALLGETRHAPTMTSQATHLPIRSVDRVDCAAQRRAAHPTVSPQPDAADATQAYSSFFDGILSPCDRPVTLAERRAIKP